MSFLTVRTLCIALVLGCIVVVASLCTGLSLTSADQALEDTKENRDSSVASAFSVGEEAVIGAVSDSLSQAGEGIEARVLDYLSMQRPACDNWANFLNTFSEAELLDFNFMYGHRRKLWYDLLSHYDNGLYGLALITANRVLLGYLETPGTTSRAPDDYHHFKMSIGYGTNGQTRSNFFTDFDKTTGDPQLVPPYNLSAMPYHTHPNCPEPGITSNGTESMELCHFPVDFHETGVWKLQSFSSALGPAGAHWSPLETLGRYVGLTYLVSVGPQGTGKTVARLMCSASTSTITRFLRSLSIGAGGEKGMGRVFLIVRRSWVYDLTQDEDANQEHMMVGASHGDVVTVNPATKLYSFRHIVNATDPIIRETARMVDAQVEGKYENITARTTPLEYHLDGFDTSFFMVARRVSDPSQTVDWYAGLVLDREYVLGNVDRSLLTTKEGIRQSEQKVDDDLNASRLLLIIALVVVAVVLTAACVAFVVTITRPLLVLQEEMSHVAYMRLEAVDEDRPISRLCEVGGMQQSFLKMMANMREYRNFMPASILEESSCDDDETISHAREPTSLGSLGDSSSRNSTNGTSPTNPTTHPVAAPRGATRFGADDVRKGRVTLVALNLCGFLTEKESATTKADHIKHFLSRVLTHCKEMRGTPDFFSGDRVLLNWNANKPCSCHREQAARFTLAVKEAHPVRASIVSGEVHMGNLGCDGMKRFGYLGSLVGWSALLVSLNKLFGTTILADAKVNQALVPAFVMCAVQRVLCEKHSAEPLVVYELFESARMQDEEWMYQLEDTERANPFKALSQATLLYFAGEYREARETVGTSSHTEVTKAQIDRLLNLITLAEDQRCEVPEPVSSLSIACL